MSSRSDWELSKENIQPLKQGRDASALKNALLMNEDQMRQQMMHFEEQLRVYSGPDPLDVWFRYICWLEQAPSGKEGHWLRKLLKKCLAQFTDKKQYHNDPRWLHVWQIYARGSASMGPLEIYQYMLDSGHCVGLSDFYIQWSTELELNNDYTKAAEIYRKAIANNAQPVEKLQYAYKDFQDRYARKLAEDRLCSPEGDSPEETRKFLGVLTGVGRKGQAPHVRQSLAMGAHGFGRSQPSNSNTQSGGFEVFDDNASNIRLRDTRMSIVPPAPNAFDLEKAHKENLRAPGVWNKAAVKQTKRHSSATALTQQKPFEVYTETTTQEAAHRRQTIGGDALKEQKQKYVNPLDAVKKPQRSSKERAMYCEESVYGGATEFSFEEIRAAIYSKRHTQRTEFTSPTETGSQSDGGFSTYSGKSSTAMSLTPRVNISSESTETSANKGTPEVTSSADSVFKKPQDLSRIVEEQNFAQSQEKSLKTQFQFPETPDEQMDFAPSDERQQAFQPVKNENDLSVKRPLAFKDPNVSQPEAVSARQPLGVKAPDPQENVTRRKPLAVRKPEETEPEPKPARAPLAVRKETEQENLENVVRQPLAMKPEAPKTPPPARAPLAAREPEAAGDPPSGGASPQANTSFTRNLYKECLAVFSNTLQLEDQYELGEKLEAAEQLEEASSAPAPIDEPKPDSFRVFCDDAPAPPPPSGGAFQIFVDDQINSATNQPPRQPSPAFDELDKENAKPADLHVSREKREIVGVLCPSKLESEPEPMETDAAVFKQPQVPAKHRNPSSLSDDLTMFDPNEPTLARFEFKPASARAASTPYHGAIDPCFSSTQPFEPNELSIAPDEDLLPPNPHQMIIAPPSLPQPPDPVPISIVPVTPVNDAQLVAGITVSERRLSAIQESSREYRSGGSSVYSSASSTGSDASTRRRVISGTATTPLVPIREQQQLTFDHTTPGAVSSLAVSAGQPSHPYECTFGRAKTPTDEEEGVVSPRELQGTVAPAQPDVDENVEKTGFGCRTKITSGVDPWDDQWIGQLLMRLQKPLETFTNFHRLFEQMPAVKLSREIELGGEVLQVQDLLGEGAFARAYKAKSRDDNLEWVLKVQKPSCPWEFYICEELRRRFTKTDRVELLKCVMQIRDAFLFDDGSILVNQFHSRGTLLDLSNKFAQRQKSMGEFLCVFFLVEMLEVIRALHSIGIIHADIKPDNFVICHLPKPSDGPKELLERPGPCLKLIDWGRSIDMQMIAQGTTFSGSANTSSFECCEMRDNRPWTFQTDYYGLLGTCHVMLFGDYMNVYKVGDSQWKSTANFKRKWNVRLWKEFFNEILNVPSCSELPDLASFSNKFSSYLTMRVKRERETYVEDLNLLSDVA